MTSIIEKRRSLHRAVAEYRQQNLHLNAQISHLQVLANMGKTASMVAHEINNLLTPISNYAALALKNPDDKELTQKALKKTLRQCSNASEIMNSLLRAAPEQSQQKKDVNLREVVEDVFQCIARDFKKDRITVNLQIPAELTVYAVPIQLQQVFMNLILNARDAMMDNGGILTIKAVAAKQAVEIQISDTGCGISEQNIQRIFEPFYSTKDKQSGTGGSGLGLAFCKTVIQAHKGSISVQSTPRRGTTFKIIIPHNRLK